MDDAGMWEDRYRDPGCLSDIGLLEIMDGEGSNEQHRHLENCPHCRRRYEQLRHIESLLRTRLYRLFCLSTQHMIDYRQGLLDPLQREQISRHLSNCPHCAAEMELLRQNIAEGGNPFQEIEWIYSVRAV